MKHYNLGRISHELVQVMPDQRTVIMGDDATNGGLFMFIADKPADLSAGTLYVAKVAQQPDVAVDQGGAFDLTWIPLGHATSDEIEQLADTLKPADILDVKTKDPQDASYTAIRYSGKDQWVKFKPGMEKAAAFLETHRWAPTVGGTLTFSKLEGVTVNAKDKIAYMAMSYIYKSMSDGKSGIKVDGDQLRRGLSAPAQGRPDRQHGQGDRQRLGPGAYEHRAGAGRQGSEGARRRRQYRGRRPHRQSRQSQILGAAARSPHRRGQRQSRQQLPLGL